MESTPARRTRHSSWLMVVSLISSMMVSPLSAAGQQASVPQCRPDNAGITLPDGFCALIVADRVGTPRHITVAANGDVFIAMRDGRGGVLALRDTTGDGAADVTARFGAGEGSDVEFANGYLYFSTSTEVLRYAWADGLLEPTGPPEVVVRDLPARGGHRSKSLAFDPNGPMYVNIGSSSNSCQIADRRRRSPGRDPCTELNNWAGIWAFDPSGRDQTQQDGARFATGLRNTVALAFRAQDNFLYGVVHGRDQLGQNWSNIYTLAQSAEEPAEEFVRIEDGNDFGWPYCYYDSEVELKVLAPEYGGDGRVVGRCSEVAAPLIGFPAHWAPNGLLFYGGTQFPERYRGGAFIAFHGSWNRAPFPQEGFNVVFVPFESLEPTGSFEIFADGFRGDDGVIHRPVGIAEGPDGSLYATDDRAGRVYRIIYSGN